VIKQYKWIPLSRIFRTRPDHKLSCDPPSFHVMMILSFLWCYGLWVMMVMQEPFFPFCWIRSLGGFPQLEDSRSKDESKHKNIKLGDIIMRGKAAISVAGMDMICCNVCFFSKAPQDFNYSPRRPCKSFFGFILSSQKSPFSDDFFGKVFFFGSTKCLNC